MFTVMLGRPGGSRGLLGHGFLGVDCNNRRGERKLGVSKKTGNYMEGNVIGDTEPTTHVPTGI